jgi:hypothetical protein
LLEKKNYDDLRAEAQGPRIVAVLALPKKEPIWTFRFSASLSGDAPRILLRRTVVSRIGLPGALTMPCKRRFVAWERHRERICQRQARRCTSSAIERLSAAGEIVLFDRSWYERTGVERVMGFCSKEQYERFLAVCPQIEKGLIYGGIQLIKYSEVSPDEQTKRFKGRANDRTKIWKLSPMDQELHHRSYDCSRARDESSLRSQPNPDNSCASDTAARRQ